MAFLAKHITGRYDFIYIPIQLPTPLVLSLLTSPFSPTATPTPILSIDILNAIDIQLPLLSPDLSWVVIQAGKQINTGIAGIPGGTSDFYEAKLEIPFLRHPQITSNTFPFTLKQHLFFSTYMMAISSSRISGLRSTKATITSSLPQPGQGGDLKPEAEVPVKAVSDDEIIVEGEGQGPGGEYEVKDWFKVTIDPSYRRYETGMDWPVELVKETSQGYWVGERTGSSATQFLFKDLHTPIPRPLKINLNISRFLSLPVDQIKAILRSGETEGHGTRFQIDEEGWIELDARGWELSVETRMEAKSLASFS